MAGAKGISTLARGLRTSLGLAIFAGLTGCSPSPVPPPFGASSHALGLTFLDPQGPIAAAQRTHLIEVVVLLLIVVLPVLVLTPILAWRYRYNGSSRYAPRWTFWWPLEFAVWGIPIAIVVVLAIWLWQGAKALDPYAPISSTLPPLRVEVVGYDWKWLFVYPDFKIASIGEFAFPAARPLALKLTSDTVMQAFFIPALGSQIYAMPGMITKLHLQANAPGSFRGENTQFNGKGFYQQNFIARAMTPADFNAWIERVRSEGIPLSDKTYDAIRRRSTLNDTRKALGAGETGNNPLYFSDVSPNLFDKVVQSFMSSSMGTRPGIGIGTAAHSPFGTIHSVPAAGPR